MKPRSTAAAIADPTRSGQTLGRRVPLWRALPWLVYNAWNRIEVTALATQVAYSLVFALPSFVLLAMSLAALLEHYLHINVSSSLQNAITDYAPAPLQDLLSYIVEQAINRTGSGKLSVTVVAALLVSVWSGSGGINACHRAYNVTNTRPFWLKRIVAMVLTAIMGLSGFLAFLLFLGGRSLGNEISARFNLGSSFNHVWNLSRWPVTTVGIAIALTMLYRFGTVTRPPFRWTLPGAVLSAFSWIALLEGFQYFVLLFNTGSPYGVAGSFIIFLVFLYLTGIVFILGALLNGVLADPSLHPRRPMVVAPVDFAPIAGAPPSAPTVPSEIAPPER